MIKEISCPRFSSATESVPRTSAKPPVLAKGAISDDSIAIFHGQVNVKRLDFRPPPGFSLSLVLKKKPTAAAM